MLSPSWCFYYRFCNISNAFNYIYRVSFNVHLRLHLCLLQNICRSLMVDVSFLNFHFTDTCFILSVHTFNKITFNACLMQSLNTMNWSPSFHYDGHCYRWTWLNWFIAAKDDGLTVVATTGAIRQAKIQSNCLNQQTNVQLWVHSCAKHLL